MFDTICKNTKCNLTEKCIKYEKKHGQNKCKQKKKFQTKCCQNDKQNNCKKCNNFKNCIIPLKPIKKLEEIQYRINEILKELEKNKENEELKEELKTLRLKEKEKIKILQRKYSDNMKIKIDSREKGKRNLPNTRKERAKEYYKKYNTTIENLEYGDYLFIEKDTEVVFEYKTIDDFMQSVFNQSVFEEVANQTHQYEYSYLIIIGSLDKYIESSFCNFARKNHTPRNWCLKSYKVYEGAIRRLRTYSNVITVKNEEKAFNEMLQQSKKCFDNKTYGGCKRRILSQNSVEYYLSGCSGVSSYTIKNIMETLEINTLEDLLKISTDDLTTVPKIGPTKAERIYEWIH